MRRRQSWFISVSGMLAAFAFASSGVAPAQAELVPIRWQADQERLEGLTIDKIEISAAPREDRAALLSLSGLAAGRPYQAEEIRRAVKVLYQLGRFENVYVQATRLGNVVELNLVLVPQPTVRELTILGDEVVMSRSAIEDALGLKGGEALDPATFAARRGALKRAYERVGYRSPAIGLAIQSTDDNGLAEVVVRIDEGPITRLRNVVVRGRPRLALWQLGDTLGLDRGEVLDLDRIDAALERLAKRYKKRGFLEVKVEEPTIREIAGDGTRPLADLILEIDAGPEVNVRFRGAHVVPAYELEQASAILADIGLGQSALAEVKERIQARYERRGYWRSKVEEAVRVTTDGSRKEVLFSIDEGEPSRVTSVSFPGRPDDTASGVTEDLLRSRVQQIVEQSLGEEFGRPAADPAAISGLIGERSIAAAPGRSEQPYPPDPDPESLYIERAYKAASAAIADQYRAAGYQTVEVRDPRVEVLPDGRSLAVEIAIEPGVRWTLGAVSITGNSTFAASRLFEVGAIDPIDPETGAKKPLSYFEIENARRLIQSYYKDHGYLYAHVDEALREVAPRGSLHAGSFVRTSTRAPLDVRQVCARAAAKGSSECDIELVFQVREGPEVRAREIVIQGLEHTQESLVLDEVSVERGEILKESDMLETQRNLQRLGIFQRVTVRTLDEKEAEEKDLVVEVRERKYSSVEIGAGASLLEGVRVSAAYSHANLFGTGLRFQTNAKVNDVRPFLFLYDEQIREQIRTFYSTRPIEFQLSAGITYPRILGLPRGFSTGLDVGFLHAVEPAFGEDTFSLALTGNYKGLRPKVLGRQRPLNLQVRAAFDLTNLSCNNNPPIQDDKVFDPASVSSACRVTSDPDMGLALVGTTTISTPTYIALRPSVSWDLRDDPLSPRAGFYAELQPGVLKGLTEESPDHFSLQGILNAYVPVPIPKGSALAVSLIYKQIFRLGEGDKPIPVNKRFSAGGRSTIRGYQEEQLRPLDPEACGDVEADLRSGVSRGGTVLAALKGELRIPITDDLAGTVFYDAGDLFCDAKNFRIDGRSPQGVGIGFRYTTPIGPLILDLAAPLRDRDTQLAGEIRPHFAAVGSF